MKGKCYSSPPSGWRLIGNRRIFLRQVIYALQLAVLFIPFGRCQTEFSKTVSTTKVESVSNHEDKVSQNNAGEDYYDYNEGHNSTDNWEISDNDSDSKLAQVIVYLSVVFLSLFGILIKYFVTQYETSKIEAQEQLHYHRLQNQSA